MKRLVIPEAAILKQCLQWLAWNGVFCWRNNTTAHANTYTRKDGSRGKSFIRTGKPGSADIIGMLPKASKRPGAFLAVECKSARGTASELQNRFRDDVMKSGGVYILARSIDDLERELKPLL